MSFCHPCGAYSKLVCEDGLRKKTLEHLAVSGGKPIYGSLANGEENIEAHCGILTQVVSLGQERGVKSKPAPMGAGL